MKNEAPTSFETPVGVLDLERVRSNALRVATYCRSHGLTWRPHIKTHKSTRIARIQLEAGAKGLTVATLREAEVMSQLTDDVLLAYPPLGESKLARLMTLPESALLTVALDSAEALKGLSEAARVARRTVNILVEVDVGLGRVGLAAPADVVRLAAQASELEGVRFQGILFYPGHIRVPGGEQDSQLSEVAALLDLVLNTLSLHGLRPETVSGGSTPTLWNSHRMPGMTELRAGSCIFNDREGLSLGVAGLGDVAYTVLATVVSVAVPGQAVVDAGSKALSKEIRVQDGSYGVVFDRPDVRVSSLSEEHGVLDLSGTDWRPRVGDAVRIIPNHVCVSVNLQDYVLVEEGRSWEVCPLEARGRGPYTPSRVAPGS